MLEVIPNTPPVGLVGVTPGTAGVRPHGPGAELHACTGPGGRRRHRLFGPGRCYIDRTGPDDVESTGRDYSESLVRT